MTQRVDAKLIHLLLPQTNRCDFNESVVLRRGHVKKMGGVDCVLGAATQNPLTKIKSDQLRGLKVTSVYQSTRAEIINPRKIKR